MGDRVDRVKDLGAFAGGEKDLIKAQCSDGNWNYDEYMHGMVNGMLLALPCIDGVSPEFLDAPDVWLKDIKSTEKAESSCESLNK